MLTEAGWLREKKKKNGQVLPLKQEEVNEWLMKTEVASPVSLDDLWVLKLKKLQFAGR